MPKLPRGSSQPILQPLHGQLYPGHLDPVRLEARNNTSTIITLKLQGHAPRRSLLSHRGHSMSRSQSELA